MLTLPLNKFDVETATTIAKADWPKIEPIALQLLDWLQDANWPVAVVLAPALANIGAPIAPYIKQILQSDDATWKYNLIQQLVARSAELTHTLKSDLERIAQNPTFAEHSEEVDCVAFHALSNLNME
ncbi:DUF5071 domain-containing protein [Undibacterium macrobrachii]|nr:DUF5071 domain-containing protein [Undibacterium macrobrachii]